MTVTTIMWDEIFHEMTRMGAGTKPTATMPVGTGGEQNTESSTFSKRQSK